MSDEKEAPLDPRLPGRLVAPALAFVAVLLVVLYAAGVYTTLGSLEFPLDDAYIYQQYARNLAGGYWFSYQPDAGYTPGSTSLVFPLLLVPGYWLGLDEQAIVSYTWILNGFFLTACVWLAARIGERLGGRTAALLAAGFLLATGSFTCGVLSGLEIGLFTTLMLLGAWYLLRDVCYPVPGNPGSSAAPGLTGTQPPPGVATRPSEEPGPQHPSSVPRPAIGLWLVAALLGLSRPEGVLSAASLIFCTLLQNKRYARPRDWVVWLSALVPFLGAGLINIILVGHFAPNSAQLKSIFASPRPSPVHLVGALLSHFGLFWKALIMTIHVPQLLPLGIVCAGIALFWMTRALRSEWAARRSFPGLYLFLATFAGIGAGCVAMVPGNYYRYYHPTLALLSIGCGLGLAAVLERIRPRLSRRQSLFAAAGVGLVVVVAGVSQHSNWTWLMKKACTEISGQQKTLGRWIDAHLPQDAYLVLNDVGAITYFGQRRIFDLVGLVTNHQAPVFLEGVGSVFERFEHFPPDNRPTHLAVYPQWLRIPQVLGKEVFRVKTAPPNVAVQYGESAVCEADWSTLGSGNRPSTLDPSYRIVDNLDIADLESEAAHHYELSVPGSLRGARFTTFLFDHTDDRGRRIVDGGREILIGETFDLYLPKNLYLPKESSDLEPEEKEGAEVGILFRLEVFAPARLRITLDGVPSDTIDLMPQGGFTEVSLPFAGFRSGVGHHRLGIRLERGGAYRVFHYWLWQRARSGRLGPASAVGE